MQHRLLHTVGLTALLALGLHATGVSAEDAYPSRPITLVVPFPPGGAGDAQARVIGQKLGEKLGQSVVVDNRPGAGTVIGAATWPAPSPMATRC